MAAVQTVHLDILPQGAPALSAVQDERVANATRSTWENFKDRVVLTWNYTVVAVTTAWAQVTSLFFNVMDWIWPSFGSKLTGLVLQVKSVIASIRQGWQQEALRRENGALRAQVELLTNRVTLLAQEKEHHMQQAQAAQEQQVNIVARETAVVAQRDLLVTQNGRLEEENRRLKDQSKAMAAPLALLLLQNKALEQKLRELGQEVADLRAKPQRDEELLTILNRLKEAGEQVRCVGEKTEIDDDLEKLLPALLRRIETAQSRLQEAKNREVPLGSLNRALTEVVQLLHRIPGALKLHADWQSNLSILQEV